MHARFWGIAIIFMVAVGLYSPSMATLPNKGVTPLPSLSPYEISPILAQTNTRPFREVIYAYFGDNLPLAIAKTKALQQQERPVGEVASFLLGELYLKQADQGEEEAIPQAMVSFQKAIADYPRSKHVPFGYLKIGGIYARQKLFYEAIGHFNRVLDRTSQDRFTRQAQMEIAHAYRAWGKWPDAKAAYETLLRIRPLDRDTKSEAMLGYADALYQGGLFDRARQYYQVAASVDPSYRFRDPISLFQFGEAAYRTQQWAQAKKLLLDFYNIHPKHPLAPVAALRAHALFQAREKAQPVALAAPSLPPLMDETLNGLDVKPEEKETDELFNLAQILLSVESLKACTKETLSDPKAAKITTDLFLNDDSVPCAMPLAKQAFLPALELSDPYRHEIRTHAMLLLENNPPSTTSQGVLLEAVNELQKYKEIAAIVEIEAAMLVNLPAFSPYRYKIQNGLNDALTHQLGDIQDPMTVITIYHTYGPAFTKDMLEGEPGFIIAMSHAKAGLLSPAAELLRPIADNYKHPLSDEALFQLGQVFSQLGDDENARAAFEQYQRRSRVGRHRALSHLGEIYFRQGEIERAIALYQDWLRKNPNDPNRKAVYLELANVHRFRNDFDKEIQTYLQWIEDDPHGEGLPHLKLADAYFQAGQYQKAVESYRLIVHNPKEEREAVEWAQLRLAMTYEQLGAYDQGKRLFRAILQTGKDPLIKRMAETHLNASPEEASLLSALSTLENRL
jgi:tetratricopeptide (TPR) repeat protein